MKKIFLGGSRAISKLNSLIKTRLNNIIKNRFAVLIGDANGADKAMQKYFHENAYADVTVYCAGVTPRNNIGCWQVQAVMPSKALKGREFYMLKDAEMAKNSDIGFMLWDAKSSGAINNVLSLLEQSKPTLVYITISKKFFKINNLAAFGELLAFCNNDDLSNIEKKVGLKNRIKRMEGVAARQLDLMI